MYQINFFSHIGYRFCSDRESFLALSAAGHAGGPPGTLGASLGPGLAPWLVLGAFKVAKAGK